MRSRFVPIGVVTACTWIPSAQAPDSTDSDLVVDLPSDETDTSDPTWTDPPSNRDFLLPDACLPIQDESVWCFSLNGIDAKELVVIGLDTGLMCPVVSLAGLLATNNIEVTNLGAERNAVNVCQGESRAAARIDILTGEVASGKDSCLGVVQHDGGLHRFGPGEDEAAWFSTTEKLHTGEGGEPSAYTWQHGHHALSGDLAYRARIVANAVDVHDLTRIDPLFAAESLPLEGFGGLVMGLSAPGNGRLYLLDDGFSQSGRIQVIAFDAATGTRVGATPVVDGTQGLLFGLDCVLSANR